MNDLAISLNPNPSLFKYIVKVPDVDKKTQRERAQWSIDNCNGRANDAKWSDRGCYPAKISTFYYFEFEDDAMRFKIAWG